MADQLVLFNYEKKNKYADQPCIILCQITTLVQAKNISYDNRPEKCVCCSKLNPWKHGTFPRQPDREKSSAESLNPVNIQRYYCKGCKKTFSAIPECISPKRWYTWTVQ